VLLQAHHNVTSFEDVQVVLDTNEITDIIKDGVIKT
jgi:hypothetical protein